MLTGQGLHTDTSLSVYGDKPSHQQQKAASQQKLHYLIDPNQPSLLNWQKGLGLI